MIPKHFLTLLASLFLSLGVARSAETPAKPPEPLPLTAAIFCDHMVLQREKPVPVWGWAKPDEEVTVEFAGQTKSGRADATGKWIVKLDPLAVSAVPRDMVVRSKAANKEIKISDVLVGDVWLCGGQSNMGVGVRDSLNAEQEIADAQYPEIRRFAVINNPVVEPADNVKGQWLVFSPQTARDLSGVPYFFGRALYRNLKIPIGLLQSSMGATAAEAWTSMEALRTMPDLAATAEKELGKARMQDSDNAKFVTDRAAWEEKYGVKPPPVSEAARGWADPSLDTSDWKPVQGPGSWARTGAKSGGVFWVRKELTLPPEAAGKRIDLPSNTIDEQYDTVYFNGQEIGRVKDEAPEFYLAKRNYRVPGNLVKAGRNIVAYRIVSANPGSGMGQLGRPLPLQAPPGATTPAPASSTDEPWLVKTETSFAPLPPDALKERPKPSIVIMRETSTALYNGGIAPLLPVALKGIIWYQGESNAFRGDRYAQILKLLIGDWRSRLGQGGLPFYIVQLANYYDPVPEPASTEKKSLDDWVSRVREGQMKVAGSVPNTALAVTIDIGEKSIHPRNKQDVGDRLARIALARTYGVKGVDHESPLYASMSQEGSSIRVKFTNCPKGLMVASKKGLEPVRETPGEKLTHFAIAGADRKFVWADAKIDGTDSVIVSSPAVPQPVALRYAWEINPEGCNLYGKNGLPASPFRTDDWPVPEK